MNWGDLLMGLALVCFAWVTLALGLYWATEALVLYKWEKLKMAMTVDQYNKTGEIPEDLEEDEEENW